MRTPPIKDRDDTDAWVMDRDADGWGPPRPLGAPWDTNANEHSMATARAGLVCVNGARPGGVGENDLYCSPDLSSAPVVMRTLSSTAEDAFATVSPDGDVIVFASNRPGGSGGFDLYAARRDGDDWTPPVNLGAPINSSADELNPSLDDDTLLFVRTTDGSRSVLAQRGWLGSVTTR